MSAPVTRARRRMPTWVLVTISGLLGLLYAYVVWSSVALLVTLATTHPLGLNGYGWLVYLLAVVFPMIAFGVSFALGYRRAPWEFALVMFAGLTVSAVFCLNVVAYGTTSYALYGG